MRKLKLQVQMTVDGYIAGPQGEMNFLTWNWDEALRQYVTDLTASVDCILLGRVLAEGFIPHWAAVAADPANPEHLAGVKFSQTPKVVFTRTLVQPPWENTTLAKGSLVEEIARLKDQPGGDLIAYGGVTFVSALVRHDLVDEYHLFINPAALGAGKSIFTTLDGKRDLRLVKASSFECGIVVLHYASQRVHEKG